MSVRGQDELEGLARESLERVDVGAHVAVGRIDHGRRAVENVIAREQQPVFLEQQADVVFGMSRRMQHAQRGVAHAQLVAVLELAIGPECPLAREAFPARPPENRRAGAFLQRTRTGQVVGVAMRADNCLQSVADEVEDALQVRRVVGSGVDDEPVARLADDVGVRSRTRHSAGIRRGEPMHVFQ